MIKRDTSFSLFFWRVAGIGLCLCECVIVLELLWLWSSLTLLEKFGLLFFGIWGIPLILAAWRGVRQRQHIEALRLHAQDAPLFPDQPVLEVAGNLSVPITLVLRLSRWSYLVFTCFWLGMLGVILAFQIPLLQASHLLWWFLLAWFLLGVLVMGLISLANYQRIEATSEALSVRQGLFRAHIRWQEARLFAVINFHPGASVPVTLYELSSARTILRWTQIVSGTGFALQPADRQEYRKLLEGLRVYIRARTGLMLRDLR